MRDALAEGIEPFRTLLKDAIDLADSTVMDACAITAAHARFLLSSARALLMSTHQELFSLISVYREVQPDTDRPSALARSTLDPQSLSALSQAARIHSWNIADIAGLVLATAKPEHVSASQPIISVDHWFQYYKALTSVAMREPDAAVDEECVADTPAATTVETGRRKTRASDSGDEADWEGA